MRIQFHPDFPRDQRKFQADYAEISAGLAARFQTEIDEVIDAVRAAPTAAGHFVNTGSEFALKYRRRNLRAFPFFVLYGCTADIRRGSVASGTDAISMAQIDREVATVRLRRKRSTARR